jgi:hypothetical protein
MAEPVVGPPLFGVFEDVVGLLNLLEALLRSLVSGVDVGMKLSGEPAVGFLDFGFGRSLRNA